VYSRRRIAQRDLGRSAGPRGLVMAHKSVMAHRSAPTPASHSLLSVGLILRPFITPVFSAALSFLHTVPLVRNVGYPMRIENPSDTVACYRKLSSVTTCLVFVTLRRHRR